MLLPHALAAAGGILSHVLYFNRGEHHMLPVVYIFFYTGTFAGSVAALVKFGDFTTSSAFALASSLFATYFAGLCTSLLTWRLYLAPINKFPGPWQAKISELWMLFNSTTTEHYYDMQRLHQKYGKYVRIGSNSLSIIDPAVMEPTFSAGSRVAKSEWYDTNHPYQSMHLCRDKGQHDRRRRIWAPGFSDKALRGYEPRVRALNDKLVERIRQHHGGPANISKWFNLYGFEAMGQLAFGRDYGMLTTGERYWGLDLIAQTMGMSPPKPPVWLFRVLLAIPGLAAAYMNFIKFCKEELIWRINNKPTESDITGWLLKAYEGQAMRPEEDIYLTGDVQLIIVAGSDTTSATLTYLFWELARKPEDVEKIRNEVLPLIGEKWSDVNIKNAQHLNACINEALRLHPPVPSGVQRVTPKEGIHFGDTYVPGKVNYWIPQYPMGRDEDNYVDANSFVPERWYSKPEMVKQKDAFAPFSLGPYGCIGKNLALIEIRTLTAQLLLEFDIKLAPGEDGHKLLHGTKDHFTVSPGELNLVFTPTARR